MSVSTSYYVLSARNLYSFAPHVYIYELENLLAKLCGATIIAPKFSPQKRVLANSPFATFSCASSFIQKTFGDFEVYHDHTPIKSNAKKILIIIGLSGACFQLLLALPKWRKAFDIVVGFVCDCYVLESFPQYVRDIDHLFIPYLEVQDELREIFQIPVTVLPFGANVLEKGSASLNRPIDITSYGRTPSYFHDSLFQYADSPESYIMYYRHGSAQKLVDPNDPYNTHRNDYQHVSMLLNMLRRSKIGLAFDNTYTAQCEVSNENLKNSNTPEKKHIHISHRSKKPILGFRWFEIGASGCAVVGKCPKTPLISQYLGWKDATIELPDDPSEGIEAIKDLLKDEDRLNKLHKRNYFEHLKHNDLRLRIATMLKTLDLPRPESLSNSLDLLNLELAQY
jgi:hypothetical protein